MTPAVSQQRGTVRKNSKNLRFKFIKAVKLLKLSKIHGNVRSNPSRLFSCTSGIYFHYSENGCEEEDMEITMDRVQRCGQWVHWTWTAETPEHLASLKHLLRPWANSFSSHLRALVSLNGRNANKWSLWLVLTFFDLKPIFTVGNLQRQVTLSCNF